MRKKGFYLLVISIITLVIWLGAGKIKGSKADSSVDKSDSENIILEYNGEVFDETNKTHTGETMLITSGSNITSMGIPLGYVGAELDIVYNFYNQCVDGCITLVDYDDGNMFCIQDSNGAVSDCYEIIYNENINNQDELIEKFSEYFTYEFIVEKILHSSAYRIMTDGKLVYIYSDICDEKKVFTTYELLYVESNEVVVNCVDWYMGEEKGDSKKEYEKYINGEDYMVNAVAKEICFINDNEMWKIKYINE